MKERLEKYIEELKEDIRNPNSMMTQSDVQLLKDIVDDLEKILEG
mgnify:CR=1 FL=1